MGIRVSRDETQKREITSHKPKPSPNLRNSIRKDRDMQAVQDARSLEFSVDANADVARVLYANE